MILQLNLTLTERRCEACHRWFACEGQAVWKCGHCAERTISEYWDRITKLERRVSALRGAIKRKRGRKS